MGFHLPNSKWSPPSKLSADMTVEEPGKLSWCDGISPPCLTLASRVDGKALDSISAFFHTAHARPVGLVWSVFLDIPFPFIIYAMMYMVYSS